MIKRTLLTVALVLLALPAAAQDTFVRPKIEVTAGTSDALTVGGGMTGGYDSATLATLIYMQNKHANGGSFEVYGFGGAYGSAVTGDVLIATNSGNLFVSPNASGKSLVFVGGTWTDTPDLTLSGSHVATFGSATQVVVQWSGNTSASPSLQVFGAIDASSLHLHNAGTTAGTYWDYGGTETWHLRQRADLSPNQLQIGTGSTEYLRVNISTGDVTIEDGLTVHGTLTNDATTTYLPAGLYTLNADGNTSGVSLGSGDNNTGLMRMADDQFAIIAGGHLLMTFRGDGSVYTENRATHFENDVYMHNGYFHANNNGGHTYDTGAVTFLQSGKPACSIAWRGVIWVNPGTPGVSDTSEICTKDASEAYAWHALY